MIPCSTSCTNYHLCHIDFLELILVVFSEQSQKIAPTKGNMCTYRYHTSQNSKKFISVRITPLTATLIIVLISSVLYRAYLCTLIFQNTHSINVSLSRRDGVPVCGPEDSIVNSSSTHCWLSVVSFEYCWESRLMVVWTFYNIPSTLCHQAALLSDYLQSTNNLSGAVALQTLQHNVAILTQLMPKCQQTFIIKAMCDFMTHNWPNCSIIHSS